MKRIVLAFGLLLSGFLPASAQIVPSGPNAYKGNLINQAGLAISSGPQMDMSAYQGSRVSAQAVYSSATFTAAAFTDGSESTGNITVNTYTALSSATASDFIVIAATQGLAGAVLNFNGTLFPSGSGGWAVVGTTTGTAKNLGAAIGGFLGSTVNVSGSVVYATAPYGSAPNSWFLISNNSSMTVHALKFSGGQDNAVLTINGTALAQGTNWNAATSNTVTAKNIAAAINTAFTTITSTNIAGVVYATSTLNGTLYNYTLASSTPAALTLSGPTLTGGQNPQDTLGSQVFNSSNTIGLTLALPVLYATGTLAIGGLVNQTTYYAVPVNAFSFSLALYSTSAVAGLSTDFVTVTSTNSSVTLHTYTLTPLALTGSATAVWQASDDDINWVSSSSFTVTSSIGATSQGYDFGFFNFHWLRLNFTAPMTGGVNLTVPVYIKQDGPGRGD
jgi:hypothetical protein